MCDEGHQDWPARGRHSRYTADQERRHNAYQLDTATCRADEPGDEPPPEPHLTVVDGHQVDTNTGEVL